MTKKNVADSREKNRRVGGKTSPSASKPAQRRGPEPAWKSPLRRAWLAVANHGGVHPFTKCVTAACAAWWMATAIPASAAILSQVPMQGMMVMPKLYYHASNGTLTISINPKLPQLTPLLVSNPGDYFDRADPWYDSLDPTCQGLAFSRRYGFVMDGNSDTVPIGIAIWIRKLSSSPGLGAYRYGDVEPKEWEPIFGTAGSTNALEWDQVMFHPCFTAAAGTQSYTATFEAFLMDTATGTPLPGGGTGPFELNWANIPDGRPTICVLSNFVLAWPAQATNYALEGAVALSGANWTAVTNVPALIGERFTVVLNPSEARKFFRLRLEP